MLTADDIKKIPADIYKALEQELGKKKLSLAKPDALADEDLKAAFTKITQDQQQVIDAAKKDVRNLDPKTLIPTPIGKQNIEREHQKLKQIQEEQNRLRNSLAKEKGRANSGALEEKTADLRGRISEGERELKNIESEHDNLLRRVLNELQRTNPKAFLAFIFEFDDIAMGFAPKSSWAYNQPNAIYKEMKRRVENRIMRAYKQLRSAEDAIGKDEATLRTGNEDDSQDEHRTTIEPLGSDAPKLDDVVSPGSEPASDDVALATDEEGHTFRFDASQGSNNSGLLRDMSTGQMRPGRPLIIGVGANSAQQAEGKAAAFSSQFSKAVTTVLDVSPPDPSLQQASLLTAAVGSSSASPVSSKPSDKLKPEAPNSPAPHK